MLALAWSASPAVLALHSSAGIRFVAVVTSPIPRTCALVLTEIDRLVVGGVLARRSVLARVAGFGALVYVFARCDVKGIGLPRPLPLTAADKLLRWWLPALSAEREPIAACIQLVTSVALEGAHIPAHRSGRLAALADDLRIGHLSVFRPELGAVLLWLEVGTEKCWWFVGVGGDSDHDGVGRVPHVPVPHERNVRAISRPQARCRLRRR